MRILLMRIHTPVKDSDSEDDSKETCPLKADQLLRNFQVPLPPAMASVKALMPVGFTVKTPLPRYHS